MIMRLSNLAKKYTSVRRKLPADENPFADWSAHLFTADHTQYILITNTVSLYSMVMFGKGISHDDVFLDRVIGYMNEFFRDDGHVFLYKRLIVPSTGLVRFSKALNKSVIGSMNDMVSQAKRYLLDPTISPFQVSCELNRMPMAILAYANPREAFHDMRVSSETSSNPIEHPASALRGPLQIFLQ